MPRRLRYRIPLDSSLFTPLQLQPTAVGRIGFNAGTRWLAENLCSHRTLIAKHRVGLVAWAWRLLYRERLGFLDADEMGVEVEARLRGRGTQLEWEVRLSGPSGVAAELRTTMVPLELAGDPSLSGRPSRLPRAISDTFEPEEVERAPQRTPVPRVVAEIERDGRRLASGERAFCVNRHRCEVADQWFWPEALSFVGEAREELVVANASSAPELRAGLSEPIRSVEVVTTKAYQFRDVGKVRTSAYMWSDSPVFVHRMELAEDPDAAAHAIAVERF